jgi:hypothetical protein
VEAETLEQLETDAVDAVEDAKKPPTKTLVGRQRLPKPLHFPRPPKFKCAPDQFFKYWRALPDECKNRSMVYVYSVWPVLNPMQALTADEQREVAAHKRRAPTTNIDKPDAPFETDDWEAELLHRWGSGSLHFKLNDSGVSGNALFPAKPVCMCDVKDLNQPDYPPVRDWRLLDMAHPSNQSLIVSLRAKGIRLPGDEELKMIAEEEDEMANVAAVEKLADTVVQMARDNTRNNQQPPAAPAPPDVQGLAGAKAVESVAQGAKQGMEIIAEAVKTANEMQAKAQDPKEYIRDMREMVTMMQPPTNGNSDLMAMMKMQHEQHMADVKAMREELAAERTRNQALLDKLISKPAEEPSKRPKSLIEELKSLSEMRDVLREFIGAGEDSDMPWYASAALKALDIIPGAVTNFMHNVAVARTGQGQPEQPATEAEVVEAAPSLPAPAQPTGPDALIIDTLGKLKADIINALATGATGYDFAAALIHATKSEQLYGFLSGQGKAGLFTILQKHKELWSETRPYAQRLEKFADEFLDTEKVKAALSIATAPNVRVVIDPEGEVIHHQAPKVTKPS